MSTVYFTSDLHLGHENILKYNRGEYSNIFDMHEALIANWNSVVGKNDITYVLGDVVYGKGSKVFFPLLDRLNGIKKLVLGNHDTYDINLYKEYFQKVYSTVRYKGYILSHIPVHPSQLEERYIGNIHGHLHDIASNIKDPRYINVNTDTRNLTPVKFRSIT